MFFGLVVLELAISGAVAAGGLVNGASRSSAGALSASRLDAWAEGFASGGADEKAGHATGIDLQELLARGKEFEQQKFLETNSDAHLKSLVAKLTDASNWWQKRIYGEPLFHELLSHGRVQAAVELFHAPGLAGIRWELLFLEADRDGKTAWHYAGERNDLQLLKDMLGAFKGDLKRPLIWPNDVVDPPLWWVNFGVEILLGADIHPDMRRQMLLAQNVQGKTILHQIVSHRAVGCLNTLLGASMDDDTRRHVILAQDVSGETALHYAVEAGQLELMETLFSAEQREDTKRHLVLTQNQAGETPLHVAFRAKRLGSVVQLLDLVERHCGNDPTVLSRLVHAQNNDGETALHIAVRRRAILLIERLQHIDLAYNATGLLAMVQNVRGQTALRIAASEHTPLAAEALLNVCPDKGSKMKLVNLPDMDGKTALHLAASRGNIFILEQFVGGDAFSKQGKQKLLATRILHGQRGPDDPDQTAEDVARCSFRAGFVEQLLLFSQSLRSVL